MGSQDAANEDGMADQSILLKLAELERVLNDPDIPFSPARVWALLAETTGALGLTGEGPSPAEVDR